MNRVTIFALASLLAFGALSDCAPRESLFEHIPAGRDSVERRLAAGDDPNSTDRGGVSALHVAAERADAEVVRLLVQRGARVAARTTADETPLFQAARRGSPEISLELLLAGAEPKAPCGALKLTPLHAAVTAGSAETVRTLLRAGADVHARTSGEETALHLAVKLDPARAIRVAEVLLAAGAVLGARDARGLTPTLVAVGFDNVDVVRWLRARGIDLAAVSPDGSNALDVAVRSEADRVAQYLAEANVTPHATKPFELPLIAAARAGSITRVRRILADGEGTRARAGEAEALAAARAGAHADVVAFLESVGRARSKAPK